MLTGIEPTALDKRGRVYTDGPRGGPALQVIGLGLTYEEAHQHYGYREHVHDNHELITVERGEYRCVLNGETLRIGPGSLLVVCPGDRHLDHCEPPLAYYALWLRLQAPTASGPLDQLRLLRPGCSPAQQIVAIDPLQLLPRLRVLLAEDQGRFAAPLRQALHQEFFWRLADSLPAERLDPVLLEQTDAAQLAFRLRECFLSAGRRNLGVREMARQLGMSESTLAHRCQRLLGLGPAKVFARFRLDQARDLLERSQLSVAAIAERLGFADSSHFVHAFRRATGLSPGRYRETPTPRQP
jgi:AraC-like DNA-binding protein